MNSPDVLTITLVQQNIIWEDKERNLLQLDSLLQNSKKTDLIVLPELFSTGFTMNVKPLSEGINGRTVQWLKQKSTDIGCYIIGSTIIKENHHYYNRLLFVTPEGNIFYYDKRHLFSMGEEDKYFTKGTKRLIVEVNGWRVCPLICYDLRFPVWSRNKNEYDLLIYVANWPAVRQNVWQNLLVARSIENQCYTLGVNRVGIDGKGIEYIGESILITAKGEILFKASNKEMVKTLELNFEALESFRGKFPVLSDRDDFLIQDETR